MKRIVWINFLWMFLVPVQLLAQDKIVTESELDSVLNPPMLKGGAVLQFEKSDIHIGKISEDDAPSAYRFTFTNVSTKSVTLTKVVTSCGCAVAEFDKKSIKSKEKSSIVLTFNPYEKAGTVDTKAFVYTNLSTQYPTAKIALVGEVTPTGNEWKGYPFAMGDLRLKRNTILFNEMNRTGVRTERMVCVNSGKRDLRLSGLMMPVYARMRTEPEVIPPGGEADIVITINGSQIPLSLKDTFTFPMVMDGLQTRPSDRTIWVKVSLAK